jgi:hypothetical protein
MARSEHLLENLRVLPIGGSKRHSFSNSVIILDEPYLRSLGILMKLPDQTFNV